MWALSSAKTRESPMTYHQRTSEERYMLSARRRQACCPAQIARQLGRHRSTMGRELRRNASRWGGWYRPSVAIENTNGRRSRSRRNRRFTAADLRLVDALLRRRWSPEPIAGRLRKTRRLCHREARSPAPTKHHRPDSPVRAHEHQHGGAHAVRLHADRGHPQCPAPQTPRLPDARGVLRCLISVAVQS